MCRPDPFDHGIFKNLNIRVCIQIPFKEDRIKPDFFNCIPKEDLLREHQGINKKDPPVLFEWTGY
ncbi:MAG: hypothetical protein A2V86_00655 [Deltaproteobacteria bacterium RBG_16_49_23]|nr:MAG: hypothetical protein A2V86_00655 [Deltaproteobacteria bacterium RBG_16_49_23]